MQCCSDAKRTNKIQGDQKGVSLLGLFDVGFARREPSMFFFWGGVRVPILTNPKGTLASNGLSRDSPSSAKLLAGFSTFPLAFSESEFHFGGCLKGTYGYGFVETPHFLVGILGDQKANQPGSECGRSLAQCSAPLPWFLFSCRWAS